jgi:hypothetical protein
MCLASHFAIIENWKLIVWPRDIYYAKKILNTFVCVEFRILVEKWNVYEVHIFPRPLLKTCRLVTTSLCLNTRLILNKNFKILIIFIENNINVCLLFDHHERKGIISKETLVLMCMARNFDNIESWKLIVWHRDIYNAKKILKTFVCVVVRILVEKWNVYGHIFPRPLLQHIQIFETTSLCLNTRLNVNKKFLNSQTFYWN